MDMHGGPSAMWGPGEFTMWHEFQLFCSFGYGVVYGNPRGSSGYGYEFQHANYKDWGDGPMADVMATLDDAIAKDSMIDADRLFLTGGSYAGYLTAWMVGIRIGLKLRRHCEASTIWQRSLAKETRID